MSAALKLWNRWLFDCLPTVLKQQSKGRHVSPLERIILTPSQPVRVCSGETANTNFIVFRFTRSGLEPTFYHTPDEFSNHYTNDVIVYNIVVFYLYLLKMHWLPFLKESAEHWQLPWIQMSFPSHSGDRSHFALMGFPIYIFYL